MVHYKPICSLILPSHSTFANNMINLKYLSCFGNKGHIKSGQSAFTRAPISTRSVSTNTNETSEEVTKRIKSLRQTLKKYSKAYYVDAAPLVSDEEYDKLFQELSNFEKQFPSLVTRSSPTQSVGSSIKTGKNGSLVVKHRYPMLSLANGFTMDDVKQFDDRLHRMLDLPPSSPLGYCVEFKYDGIALSIHYKNGEFHKALTRGDGKQGEDVTEAIRKIMPSVTSPLKNWSLYGSNIEVRGEAYLTKEAFAECNATMKREASSEQVYVNARNLASGLLKRKYTNNQTNEGDQNQHDISNVKHSENAEHKDSKKQTSSSGLPAIDIEMSFVAYQLILEDQSIIKTHWDSLNVMSKEMGLPSGFPWIRQLSSISEFQAVESHWSSIRSKLPFEADGIVIKLDDLQLQKKVGANSHSPRFALAWKFSAKQATTVIKDIELSVGRTGRVTPVALVEPVLLSGSLISRATLHNRDYVDKHNFVPGCKVIIERSGEVIPKIVSRVDDSAAILANDNQYHQSSTDTLNPDQQESSLHSSSSHSSHLSSSHLSSSNNNQFTVNWNVCPCQQRYPLVQMGNVDIFCTSPTCLPQRQRQLEHFCAALEIEGLGPSSLEQLKEFGMISDISDVFELGKHAPRLRVRNGWGEKKVENLLQNLEKSKQQAKFETVLFALGVPRMGKETSRSIALKLKTMEALMKSSAEELEKIEDIGPIVARSIASYLKEEYMVNMVEKLREQGLPMEVLESAQRVAGETENSNDTENVFLGKSFVLTGAMSEMSRKEATEMINRAGGVVKSTVTSQTDMIIHGEAPDSAARSNSKKLIQAREKNIPIITETQFLSFLKQLNNVKKM